MKGLTLASPPEALAERLAALTPGLSGADIYNICNEGAILAAREGAEEVHMYFSIDFIVVRQPFCTLNELLIVF